MSVCPYVRTRIVSIVLSELAGMFHVQLCSISVREVSLFLAFFCLLRAMECWIVGIWGKSIEVDAFPVQDLDPFLTRFLWLVDSSTIHRLKEGIVIIGGRNRNQISMRSFDSLKAVFSRTVRVEAIA
jgi:hypothetical protein